MKQLIVIMGVCGSGKSTISQTLSEKLEAVFLEGDEFHPAENIKKMAGGEPLTNVDREAWIDAMAMAIRTSTAPMIILSCSALNSFVRDRLSAKSGETADWVYLKVSRAELVRRMRARKDHFMKEGMIDSQLEAMNPPEDAIVIDGDLAPDAILSQILPHFTQ